MRGLDLKLDFKKKYIFGEYDIERGFVRDICVLSKLESKLELFKYVEQVYFNLLLLQNIIRIYRTHKFSWRIFNAIIVL